MVNIYDTANELSNQLKETQEYQGLKKAFDSLKADSHDCHNSDKQESAVLLTVDTGGQRNLLLQHYGDHNHKYHQQLK